METFSQNLRRARIRASIKQGDLARELGISKQLLCYYEGQCTNPYLLTALRFAEVLNVSLDELAGNVKPKEKLGGNKVAHCLEPRPCPEHRFRRSDARGAEEDARKG